MKRSTEDSVINIPYFLEKRGGQGLSINLVFTENLGNSQEEKATNINERGQTLD